MKAFVLSLSLLAMSALASASEMSILSCFAEDGEITVNMYAVPGFSPAVEIFQGSEMLMSGHFGLTYQAEPVEAWILTDGTGDQHITAVANGEGTAVANIFLKLEDGTEIRRFGAACKFTK